MLLHIVARGKIGRGAESVLFDRYMDRLAWPWKLTELAETPRRGEKIPAAAPPTRTIILDELGEQASSQMLASRLGQWRDDGVKECRILIGGADGFDDAARRDVDWMIAFGRATWPHLLARAMLAEQLYRASTILAGHPYHREG